MTEIKLKTENSSNSIAYKSIVVALVSLKLKRRRKRIRKYALIVNGNSRLLVLLLSIAVLYATITHRDLIKTVPNLLDL